MRILVTGGAGYIGSHTVKLLLARGHEVTVFDNLSMGHRKAVPSERLIVGDLKDTDHLDHVLVVNQIEAVVHFAASAFVGESVTNPSRYYLNNLRNSIDLLERCRRHQITRFVFSSTCATYGYPTAIPITESEKQTPINPYGSTKLAFERMLSDYCAAYQIGYASLRYFNAAGASEDATIGEDHTPETHLIPLAIQVALGNRPHLEIFGTDYPTPDGTCIRDYVHVDDLAEAHILSLLNLKPGVGQAYNVGIGKGYSVREVIKAVEMVTKRAVNVRETTRRAGDPPTLVAASDLIRKELGWKPRYQDLQSIVETAWRWHEKNPKGYGS